jgi:hypothetical protein
MEPPCDNEHLVGDDDVGVIETVQGRRRAISTRFKKGHGICFRGSVSVVVWACVSEDVDVAAALNAAWNNHSSHFSLHPIA